MNIFKNRKIIIITIIVIGVIIVAGYGIFRFFNERNQGEVNHIDHFTKSSTVSEVMNNASFKGFGNLIFSVDRTSSPNYLVTMELQIASFWVFYFRYNQLIFILLYFDSIMKMKAKFL